MAPNDLDIFKGHQINHFNPFLLLLAYELYAYLSSPVKITCPCFQILVVFNSSVIQVTLVFSRHRFDLKVITDTVRFQVTLCHAEIFVYDVNGSNHVILQSVVINRKSGKSQIAALT